MRTEIQYRFSRNTFWVTLLAVFFAITIALVIMNQKFDSEAILILILFGFCELLISLLFFQHMFYIITRRPALILDEEYITMHHFFGKRRAACDRNCCLLSGAPVHILFRTSAAFTGRQVRPSFIHRVPPALDWLPALLLLHARYPDTLVTSYLGQLKSHALWSR